MRDELQRAQVEHPVFKAGPVFAVVQFAPAGHGRQRQHQRTRAVHARGRGLVAKRDDGLALELLHAPRLEKAAFPAVKLARFVVVEHGEVFGEPVRQQLFPERQPPVHAAVEKAHEPDVRRGCFRCAGYVLPGVFPPLSGGPDKRHELADALPVPDKEVGQVLPVVVRPFSVFPAHEIRPFQPEHRTPGARQVLFRLVRVGLPAS